MIGALGLGYFLVMFHRQSLAIMSIYIVEDLNMSPAGLGALGAVMLYAYAAMQIPGGFIADRFGARRTVAGSLVLTALATVLFASAKSLPGALVARAISGFAMAAIYVPALTAVKDWCPDDSFPFYTSLIFTFGNLGGLFSKGPSALLADNFGWRKAYVVMALITFAVAVIVWLAVPEKRDNRAPDAASGAKLPLDKDSLASVIKSGSFVTLLCWFFIFSGTTNGFEGLWATTYLVEVQGLAKLQVASILTYVSVMAMITGPIAGALAKRRGDLVFIVTSYLRAFFFVMFALLPGGLGYSKSALVFLLKGFAHGGLPIAFAQVRKLSPAHLSGTLLGVSNTLAFLGGASVTQIMGLAMNNAPQVGYQKIFTKMFVLFAILVTITTTLVCFTNYWRSAKPVGTTGKAGLES